METIATIPIFVSVFTVLVILIITGLFGERKHYKSLNMELQDKLNTISEQNVELISLESEVRNKHATLRNFEERCVIQGNAIAALVEASAHAMLTVDSRMCVLHFNKRFCEVWDLSEEKVRVGMGIHTLLQHCMEKTSEPEIFFLNHHRIDHLQDATWGTEAHMSDGRILRSSSSPIQGVDGTYYGRIWELIDVTERIQGDKKLAEVQCALDLQHEKLAATKKELRHQYVALNTTHTELMHQSQIIRILKERLAGALCIFDEKKNLSYFNQKFLDIWDTSGKELKENFPWRSFIQTQAFALHNDAEAEAALIDEVIDDRTRFLHDEITLVNGTMLERYSSPLIDEKGEYYGRLWEFTDITERVQDKERLAEAHCTVELQHEKLTATEEELRHQYVALNTTHTELMHQNQILRILKERLAGGICIFDEKRNLSCFNQKFIDIWDPSGKEFKQKSPWESFIQTEAFALHSDADAQAALIDEVLRDRTRFLHDEITLVNGTILERYSTPLIDEKGVYYGRLWEFIDITERIKEKERLAEAHRTVERQYEKLAATEEELRHQYVALNTT